MMKILKISDSSKPLLIAGAVAALVVFMGAKSKPPQDDQRGGSLDLFVSGVPLVEQRGFKSVRRIQ